MSCILTQPLEVINFLAEKLYKIGATNAWREATPRKNKKVTNAYIVYVELQYSRSVKYQTIVAEL
jgi:hypothetical protein